MCSKLIPNQASYDKSWTSYFVGQTKNVTGAGGGSVGTATVRADGTIYVQMSVSGYGSGAGFTNVPFQSASAVFNMPNVACNGFIGAIANPIFSNTEIYQGLPPHDWSIGYGDTCMQSTGY